MLNTILEVGMKSSFYGGLLKYVNPFRPGFKLSHLDELENNITCVQLTLEINQGDSMILN